jgi:hypothetical protein
MVYLEFGQDRLAQAHPLPVFELARWTNSFSIVFYIYYYLIT